ncbi:MAG: VWA domain-containing protein [Calditrichaeota bacterium]|nr:VWA domain-containing protein [Calditrichota bacterium]
MASPELLALALAAIPLIWLYIRRARRIRQRSVFRLPTYRVLNGQPGGRWKRYFVHAPAAGRWGAIILMAIALARPQSVSSGEDVWSEGIDIVLALDISASMLARDLRPDRAEAAKSVAAEFIAARPNDRIGLVLFAKHAFTQCPLTIDHDILRELLSQVEIGLVDADNTAIGSALATALKRLDATTSKSKVIILLTDGENNYGLPPTTAAEAAQALGARVYTIGVGTRGTAPYPSRDVFGRIVMQQVRVSIDEPLLREIAGSTGGRYFRATDENKLREIFAEIDRMEKQRTLVRAYRKHAEMFYPWAWGAFALVVAGLFIEGYFLRSAV